MLVKRVAAVLIGLVLGCAAAKPPLTARDRALQRKLNAVLKDPGFQQGFWGVYVYSLDRRRVLFDHNGEKWFTPASNAKLFTLAAALKLLGRDFRFHTAVQSTAAPDAQGVVHGDVALIGVGDPSFSGRPYPYKLDPPEPALPYDPMLAPRQLAAALAAKGIRRISGNIIGDDSYFTADPYPGGWAIGDMLWDYGAPVSALTLNDNTRFLQVYPGAAVGDAPRLVWTPALDPPAVELTLTTVAANGATDINLETDPLNGALRLSGSIARSSPGVLQALAVREPALYAAGLLRAALIEKGIVVEGAARARHLAPPPASSAYELASWDSPPLAEILQVTAKVSQNLEAELMLRLLGKLRGASLSHYKGPAEELGSAVRSAFLHSAGLAETDAVLSDGSGLARNDLITPAGMVRLLRYMDQQPEAAEWRALFPIAATDGTLDHRFLHAPAAGRLRAKTGSLSHVYSLSGYIVSRHGERLAFSLLSNNVDHPASQARAQLDRLGNVLAAW
ncbi:MAG: D-alanyl-D-alanine carboxypeptidase/D-alanyl-D-alanine endopeptidase [Terriglobales bacterium]